MTRVLRCRGCKRNLVVIEPHELKSNLCVNCISGFGSLDMCLPTVTLDKQSRGDETRKMPNVNDIYPKKTTEYKTLMNSSHIKKPTTFTISEARVVEMNGEKKIVIGFKDSEFDMVVNPTNARTLAEKYGENTDEWSDEEVTLASVPVTYQGKTVKGIRVV